jgi:hypothetical protein
MLSGMLGLLSFGCAKARVVAPAKASVMARHDDLPARNVGRKLLKAFEGRRVAQGTAHVTAPAIGAGSIAGKQPKATAMNAAEGCRLAQSRRAACGSPGGSWLIVPVVLETKPDLPQHVGLCLTPFHLDPSPVRAQTRTVYRTAVEELENGHDKRLVKMRNG